MVIERPSLVDSVNFAETLVKVGGCRYIGGLGLTLWEEMRSIAGNSEGQGFLGLGPENVS